MLQIQPWQHNFSNRDEDGRKAEEVGS